jgi:hypothetical protein
MAGHAKAKGVLNNLVIVVCTVALVTLMIVVLARESLREYGGLVKQVNDGLIRLANDISLQVIDSGQHPLRHASEARFARLGGSYRNVWVSVSIDGNTTDELKTRLTLQPMPPMPLEASLARWKNFRTSTAKVTLEVTPWSLILLVSSRRGLWDSPLLAFDRVPEADPARLRAVLDEVAALADSQPRD